MAISLNREFKGLTLQDAYHRIASVDVTKSEMTFSVSVGVNEESEQLFAKCYHCNYDIEGNNPIKQAYEHLKSLEEYAGSKDC